MTLFLDGYGLSFGYNDLFCLRRMVAPSGSNATLNPSRVVAIGGGKDSLVSIEALRKAGFADRAVWDIAAVASFFNMTNSMATAIDMMPNVDYHAKNR